MCPRVEAATPGTRGAVADVRAAQEEYARLRDAGVFGDADVALLHGGMDAAQKADVMEKFRR